MKNKRQHISKSMYSTGNEKILKKVFIDIMEQYNNRLKDSNYEIILLNRLTVNDLQQIIIANNNIDKNNLSTIGLNSYISPDGGFLFLRNKNNNTKEYLLAVCEAKRQGTNDIRQLNGLKPQAKGNAIERLGKNLAFIRSLLKHENITPFVCFGHGSDFDTNSTILGRIIQMNYGYKNNKLFLYKEGNGLDPISMFFRKDIWEEKEIYIIVNEIVKNSLIYYKNKYNLTI